MPRFEQINRGVAYARHSTEARLRREQQESVASSSIGQILVENNVVKDADALLELIEEQLAVNQEIVTQEEV